MADTMKVYNLSDVKTPKLEQNRLVDAQFEVCGGLAAPGKFVEVPLDVWVAHRGNYERLLNLGALVEGELPASYLNARKAGEE